MSQMNPCLSEIINKIIPSIVNRSVAAQSEDKLQEMQQYYAGQIENAIINIRYFNLRTVVETVFPPFGVKIVNGSHLDFEMKHYVRKRTFITLKQPEYTSGRPSRPRLPSPGISSESAQDKIPARIKDYFDNLLLHKKREESCPHQQVWGGWAKYHPLDNFTKYTDSLDEDGISKATINFQLKLETCGQIDLKMMTPEGIQEMETHVQKFKDRTLHLFSINLLDSQADFLRDQTNKLAVSGPSNLDDVAIDKVFSNNVKCLLGLWESECSNVSEGILLCQSPKTYFAFVPRSFSEFFSFLTFNVGLKVVWPLVRALTKALGHDVPKSIQFDIPNNELSESQKKRVSESIYGFGIMNIMATKKRFQEILISDAGLRRFKDIHQNHHEGILERLSQGDNQLSRYHSKHLVGCQHDIKWKGLVEFSQDVYRCEVDPDLMIFQKTCFSAWAFQCRSCLESLNNRKELVEVPSNFWRLMRSSMLVLMIKVNVNPEISREREIPTIVFEFGSVNKDIIEFLKKSDTTVLSFLSNNKEPRKMEYLIQFYFHNGKVLGDIFYKGTETFQVIWTRLRSHSWSNNTFFCREFFGVVGSMSSGEEGSVDFVPDRSSEASSLYEKFIRYQCPPPPPVSIDHNLGNVLWTGELQTFFISSQPVRGYKKAEEFCRMSKHMIAETVGHVQQEDLGSTRNCPFLSPTGHFVYSNYAALTGTDTADLHFKRRAETAVGLIAFNVERKVVENIIGTFKKCFVYNLHIQDFQYIFSELRDTKTTLLTFLLEKNELVRDVLKTQTEEFAKRLFILKYDQRENVIKAYFPKEKDKILQIWKSVSKTSLMSSHEKMFRKLKKPDRREATATVSITNVTNVNLDGEEVTNTQVQRVEIVLNEKTKKPKEKKSKEEKADAGIDLGQNLKKMFTSLSTSEGTEGAVDGGEEKGRKGKVRECWNCGASTDCEGVSLLKCQGCKRARYCDVTCQTEDWEQHREYCQEVQDRREARRADNQ